jgi:hypothetical protein
MSGPYETERQARTSVRHILDSPTGTGAWKDGNHRLLEGACQAVGVKLGAYDHRVLLWLASFEPQICAVIAGLITRARALAPGQLGTILDALDVAAEYKRDRAATCGDCEASPAELCGTCEWRLARADEYDALAETLRSQQ